MRWLKIGKIFDPTYFKFDGDYMDFSQSPQTLIFDDFIRIYFSTRKMDLHNGKYLSYISFVDMDKSFQRIINVSSQPVIKLGELGCFDEHGIFPMNVIRVRDKIYGYTGGWSRRVSVSVDTSIGLAISHDNGITYERTGGGPVLTSSLREPFLVGDPFVRIFNNTFYMWYIFGIKWKVFSKGGVRERIYKIGLAKSKDGLNWNKAESGQIISDKLNPDESQALPSIIDFSGKYHMFFCYRYSDDFRANRDRSYRIGYAFSDDLENWIRDDGKVGIDISEGCWDSDMLCYPHVFKLDNNIYMLYNGNEFGRYGFGLAILDE